MEQWHNFAIKTPVAYAPVDFFNFVFSAFFYRAVELGHELNYINNRITVEKNLSADLWQELDNLGVPKIVSAITDDKGREDLIYVNNDTFLGGKLIPGFDNDEFIIDCISCDHAVLEQVKDILEKFALDTSKQRSVYVLCDEPNGRLGTRSIGRPGHDLIRENYSDETLKGYDFIIDELGKKEPFGRLVIMHGPPGSGKTHLLKSVVNDIDLERFAIISLQPDFLAGKSISSLTRILLDKSGVMMDDDELYGDEKELRHTSLILLVEDAEACLVPRGNDNMSAITNLLNFADGFLGSMLDVRIVVTTNASSIEVDQALKRPGRLCKVINVDKLPKDKANKAYQCITKKDKEPFDESVILADVYKRAYTDMGRLMAVDIGDVSTHSVGFKR